MTFIDGDHDAFGDGGVRLIFAPGHTAGHQLLQLQLDNTVTLLLSRDLYDTRANRKLGRAPTFNDSEAQTLESVQRVEALLSATDASLWIEHDKALADSLRKAPRYCD